MINHHAHLDWLKFAVCSTDEEVEFMNENGWYAYRYDNLPLGRKLDMGLRAALTLKWDRLVLIGSDDFLSHEYVTKVEALPKEVDWAGVKKIYFVDSKTWKAKAHTYSPTVAGKMFIGAGRVLSRRVVEDVIERHGQMYTWRKNNGLDFDSEQRILLQGYKPHMIESKKPLLMDLKSEGNIWSFNAFQSRAHLNKEVTMNEIKKQIGYEKPLE